MKRLITCLFLTIYAIAANAQATSLFEDFNTDCALSSGTPMDWTYFNPLSSTIPDGQWACAPLGGRYGTHGIACTGVWGTPAAYHLDTSYLVSPALNLSGYTDSIFLHFDTKTSNIDLAARMSIIVSSSDSTFDTAGGHTFSDVSGALTPLFGNDDSTEWVTHVANLTPFKTTTPLYIAFRYTSTTTTGSTWYLDNVYTTPFSTQVSDPQKNSLSLDVIGSSTSSRITLSCKTTSPGLYQLAVYDMLGRQMYKGETNMKSDKTTYTIDGLDLAPGMYLVRMSNGIAYGTAKTVVQ